MIIMLNIHDFTHPLNGAQKREIQFSDFTKNKIKIHDIWIDAVFIKGQISIKAEDYYKIFS